MVKYDIFITRKFPKFKIIGGNGTFKRLVSGMMAVALFLSFSVTALAMDNKVAEQVTDSKGNPLVEVKLNVNNSEEVERVFKEYRVHEQQAEDIRRMIDQYNKDATEDLIISLYVPNPKARDSQRYYTGFKNKRYYESLIKVGHHSKEKRVKNVNNLDDYLDSVVTSTVTMAVDSALNVISGGAWSIVSLFVNLPNDGVGYTTVEHMATMYEEKWVKYTYYIENGEEYLGSTVEKTTYFFENIIKNPNLSGSYRQADTPKKTVTVKSWNIPDEKAYYHWPNGGYREQIVGFDYGEAYFDSIRG